VKLIADVASSVKFLVTRTLKRASDYGVVGNRVPRAELPAKDDGTPHLCSRRARRWHAARTASCEPASIGAKLVSVDDGALRDNPRARDSSARVTSWGVVAEREEDAVRASKAIKATWGNLRTASRSRSTL
jgi:nicotinate dehydrogenase subunit B